MITEQSIKTRVNEKKIDDGNLDKNAAWFEDQELFDENNWEAANEGYEDQTQDPWTSYLNYEDETELLKELEQDPQYHDYQEWNKCRILIDRVIKDLSAKLQDEERKAELQTARDTAIELMHKYKIAEELRDPENIDAYERAILLLAIAYRWSQTKENEYSKRKMLARHLTLLYRGHERQYASQRHRELGGVGLPFQIALDIFQHVWPEFDGTMKWLHDNVAKDHIVVIPLTYEETQALFEQLFEKYNIPEINRKIPTGFAIPSERIFCVWKDTKPKTIIHEKQHLTNAGLRIGTYGSSLDEGMTDLKTLQIMQEHYSVLFGVLASEPYSNDAHIFFSLQLNEPKIYRLLEERYKNKFSATSQNCFAGLINQFGLEGMFDLFDAIPCPLGTVDPETGFISAREAMQRVGLKREIARLPGT